MHVSIVKPHIKYTEAISTICATGWKQTVEGKLSKDYQEKNVNTWYRYERVYNDNNVGLYSPYRAA
ncbi:hypothetical protein [Aquibacillus rhizosphaerae]|uniref:Uncharacterized protein n=1 Tax=Aquibacillus rhizosphaerae TaxID=3051431 RepID=A0ABT7L8X9_9BACI|nr:hypothetical protein [Aquibacillus sp. LR5S19]MDL4842322.1 hypothetical protein [Aquibacillus sp. LR5S19]